MAHRNKQGLSHWACSRIENTLPVHCCLMQGEVLSLPVVPTRCRTLSGSQNSTHVKRRSRALAEGV